MLGQGEDVKESKSFAPLKYEVDDKSQFEDVFFAGNLAIAVSKSGEIWLLGGEEFKKLEQSAFAEEESLINTMEKAPEEKEKKLNQQ